MRAKPVEVKHLENAAAFEPESVLTFWMENGLMANLFLSRNSMTFGWKWNLALLKMFHKALSQYITDLENQPLAPTKKKKK